MTLAQERRCKDSRMRKSQTNKIFPWALIVAGLCAITLGVILYLDQMKGPKTTIHSVQVNSAPSSNKLSAAKISDYTVPPTAPRYIAIPAIGIRKTPVLALGLLSSGAIATPDNIYEAGWYNGSSLPGQPGAMFIYGHVSSWTANGLFYNLKKLVAGNKVYITRGDNKVFTYTVLSTKVYPYNGVDMSQVLSPIRAGRPGLSLMTCTGQVMHGTNEFNERLVVFTGLQSS